ncbi:hypothetical protein BH09PAT1_BH09PAT1_8290 [soil metagenome]
MTEVSGENGSINIKPILERDERGRFKVRSTIPPQEYETTAEKLDRIKTDIKNITAFPLAPGEAARARPVFRAEQPPLPQRKIVKPLDGPAQFSQAQMSETSLENSSSHTSETEVVHETNGKFKRENVSLARNELRRQREANLRKLRESHFPPREEAVLASPQPPVESNNDPLIAAIMDTLPWGKDEPPVTTVQVPKEASLEVMPDQEEIVIPIRAVDSSGTTNSNSDPRIREIMATLPWDEISDIVSVPMRTDAVLPDAVLSQNDPLIAELIETIPFDRPSISGSKVNPSGLSEKIDRLATEMPRPMVELPITSRTTPASRNGFGDPDQDGYVIQPPAEVQKQGFFSRLRKRFSRTAA